MAAIRQADIGDAQRIAEIHVLGWQVGYRGLLPQPVLDDLRPAQRVPRWAANLQRADWPRRGTLLAEDTGSAVGFADLRPAEDEPTWGEIASFYVLPAAWGRGIGRALMDASVAMFCAAGYASAVLWVLESNSPAILFYDRLGWKPDGAVRDDVVGGAAIRDRRYRRALE